MFLKDSSCKTDCITPIKRRDSVVLNKKRVVRSRQPGRALENDHRVQEKPVTDLSQEIKKKKGSKKGRASKQRKEGKRKKKKKAPKGRGMAGVIKER